VASQTPRHAPSATSVDKALSVCEVLSAQPDGLSVSELARTLELPVSTVHRLLAGLRTRGYVRQDEGTSRYSLTLKVLDLGFRLLGRSELKLHAYPVLREYALRTGARCFVAVPASGGEVTYVWNAGPDEVAMHTAYGKEMPSHCSVYLDPLQETRRLSCLRLVERVDVASSDTVIRRFGPSDREGTQRLICTCAPVQDYTGREVARVGVFMHSSSDGPILSEHDRGAWELARLISMRLGHLPGASVGVTA
jgi:DNA-binding IclR family transcriptional regulator